MKSPCPHPAGLKRHITILRMSEADYPFHYPHMPQSLTIDGDIQLHEGARVTKFELNRPVEYDGTTELVVQTASIECKIFGKRMDVDLAISIYEHSKLCLIIDSYQGPRFIIPHAYLVSSYSTSPRPQRDQYTLVFRQSAITPLCHFTGNILPA